MNTTLKAALISAAVVATGALAACSPPSFMDAPPPEPYVEPIYQAPPPPPAPPAPPPPPPSAYEPGPYSGAQPEFQYQPMAPIPNPEDLSPQDYARIYGPGERARQELAGGPPAPPPRVSQPAPPISRSAAVPAAPAPRPATQTVAPVVTPPLVARPSPEASDSAEVLGELLAGPVQSDAELNIPPAIANGQSGIVILSLPPSFGERLRAGASQLGIDLSAKTAEIRARLIGEGYEILPVEEQFARLKEGEATTFSWQVTPGAAPSGDLKAEIGGTLKEGGRSENFDLGALQEPVDPYPTPAEPPAAFSEKAVAGGILAILALIAAGVFAARRARRRTDEELSHEVRRNRTRRLTADELEP